ncbi:hypothetical protein ACOME3_007541 [Neoechinorhynchus agilis]
MASDRDEFTLSTYLTPFAKQNQLCVASKLIRDTWRKLILLQRFCEQIRIRWNTLVDLTTETVAVEDPNITDIENASKSEPDHHGHQKIPFSTGQILDEMIKIGSISFDSLLETDNQFDIMEDKSLLMMRTIDSSISTGMTHRNIVRMLVKCAQELEGDLTSQRRIKNRKSKTIPNEALESLDRTTRLVERVNLLKAFFEGSELQDSDRAQIFGKAIRSDFENLLELVDEHEKSIDEYLRMERLNKRIFEQHCRYVADGYHNKKKIEEKLCVLLGEIRELERKEMKDLFEVKYELYMAKKDEDGLQMCVNALDELKANLQEIANRLKEEEDDEINRVEAIQTVERLVLGYEERKSKFRRKVRKGKK